MPPTEAREDGSIGTLKEKTLHRQLKGIYAEGGCVEYQVGSYVCDARRPSGELIEIQTANFSAIASKLKHLASSAPVRLVHPVAVERYIEVRDQQGSLLRKRKSPRKGSPWNLYTHLVRTPTLMDTPNLTIEVLLIAERETRVDDGRGSWRRKGVSILDRYLVGILDSVVLRRPADLLTLLPTDLPEPFTSSDLAREAGIATGLARKALYVLVRNELIEELPRKGRAKRYALTESRTETVVPSPLTERISM